MGMFDDLIPSSGGGGTGEPLRVTVRPQRQSSMFDDLIPAPNAGQSRDFEEPSGSAEAFGRGLKQGVTFNFYDELSGLARAGGLEPDDPDVARALKSLFVGAYRKFKGDEEAEKLYQEERDKQRALTEKLQAESPGASLAGNVAGAVLVPVGGLTGAATLPARIGRGAALGAGTGALAGFGEGEGLAGSAKQGAIGFGIGVGVGAAVPPAIEGLLRGGRAVSQGVRSAVRGAVNPEAEASRRVASTVERGIRADPAATQRLTPQELLANRQVSGPATLMDIGGEPARALARSAANTSPEGRQLLNTAINERFEEQGPRITQWLRHTFNFPDARAQQQAIEQAAKAANKPAYARAFRDGSVGIWDQELAELSQAPAMQDAVKAAIRQAQNRSAPDVSQGADALNARWVAGNKPTLEFWDLVKRQVDQEINVAKRAGRNEDVMELTRIKSMMVGKLDAAVPSYAQARAGAASFFGAENALEAGQNFVMQNFAIPETRAALARMSAQERKLFQDGFVSRLVETIERTGDRRNVVNQIWGNAASRDKIRLALGPQRAAELEAGLRIEGIMDFARGAVQGNSTTARQLAELGLAGGGLSLGSVGTYQQDPTQMTIGAVLGALAYGGRRIDQRVAQQVAQMLVSNDPAILARGVRIIARSENFMNALRRADRAIVPIAQQAQQLGAEDRSQQNAPAEAR